MSSKRIFKNFYIPPPRFLEEVFYYPGSKNFLDNLTLRPPIFGPTWRSYKLTFVCSFVRLLPAFFEIGSLVFSDFWHKDAKWQCLKCDGARFSEKNFFRPKMPEKPVFWHFLEISSLVFGPTSEVL